MNDLDSKLDPRALLESFVASKRCEKVFARLVDSLNGLVYTSALRRTGSPQLAEEIAKFAREASGLDPEAAAAWANEIQDEGLREEPLRQVEKR